MIAKKSTSKSVVPKPKVAGVFIDPRTDFGFKPIANKESKVYFTRAIFDSTLSAASQPDRSPHDGLSGSIDLTVSKRKNPQKLTVRSINKKIFTDILTEAELANLSPDELDMYDKSLKNYNKNMTPREIIKEYQKINAVLQNEVAELAEYRRRYGALNGANPTRITKVRTTRAKSTV